MSWTKLPPIQGKYGGCLNCGVRPSEFPMDAVISVGFGDAGISKDGQRVWSDDPRGEREPKTGKDAEAMALADPDHDWRIHLLGPLSGREYQRQDTGKWLLIEQNQGFA